MTKTVILISLLMTLSFAWGPDAEEIEERKEAIRKAQISFDHKVKKCDKGDLGYCRAVASRYRDGADYGGIAPSKYDREEFKHLYVVSNLPDLKKALELFVSLCEKNEYHSCYDAAKIYEYGSPKFASYIKVDSPDYIDVDFDKAIKYYKRSCNDPDVYSCDNKERIPNLKIASKEAKACEAGDVASCVSLGDKYKEGIGEANYTNRYQLQHLYSRACELGSGYACYALGTIYKLGWDGKDDLAKAMELFNKSCGLGNSLGCKEANSLNDTEEDSSNANSDGQKLILMKRIKDYGGLELGSASDFFKKDREIVLLAVKSDSEAFKYADKSLKSDKEIVMAAISDTYMRMEYANDDIKRDKVFMLEAVKKDGMCLKYADKTLQADKDVALEAIESSSRSGNYIASKLYKDRDFMMLAVKASGSMLRKLDSSLSRDKEIILTALKDDCFATRYMDKSYSGDKEMALAILKETKCSLKFFDEKIRNDKDVIMAQK